MMSLKNGFTEQEKLHLEFSKRMKNDRSNVGLKSKADYYGELLDKSNGEYRINERNRSRDRSRERSKNRERSRDRRNDYGKERTRGGSRDRQRDNRNRDDEIRKDEFGRDLNIKEQELGFIPESKKRKEKDSWHHDKYNSDEESIDRKKLIPDGYKPPSPEWISKAGGVAIMQKRNQ